LRLDRGAGAHFGLAVRSLEDCWLDREAHLPLPKGRLAFRNSAWKIWPSDVERHAQGAVFTNHLTRHTRMESSTQCLRPRCLRLGFALPVLTRELLRFTRIHVTELPSSKRSNGSLRSPRKCFASGEAFAHALCVERAEIRNSACSCDPGQSFRRNPIAHSGGIRSLIPKESERVRRLMTLDGDWSL
jgi:hypothetical protein